MKAKGNAPVVSPHCDSCRSTTDPTEVRRMEGIEVRICIAAAPCIGRAKAAGIWKSVVPGRSES